MKVNDQVLVDGLVGRICWMDNPWIDPKTNQPADILTKVSVNEEVHWHRLSELQLLTTQQKTTPKMENKPKINFEQFQEIERTLDIRYGRIFWVERVPKSTKMLKMLVRFGDADRTVMTNIGSQLIDEQELVDREFPFIVNLEPAKIMGSVSEAMIMVPTNHDGTINFDLDGLENCKLL
jgi:methionine--tRNA ligase beta chain